MSVANPTLPFRPVLKGVSSMERRRRLLVWRRAGTGHGSALEGVFEGAWMYSDDGTLHTIPRVSPSFKDWVWWINIVAHVRGRTDINLFD